MTKPEETTVFMQPEQQQQERHVQRLGEALVFSMEEFRAAKEEVLREHSNLFLRLKDA